MEIGRHLSHLFPRYKVCSCSLDVLLRLDDFLKALPLLRQHPASCGAGWDGRKSEPCGVTAEGDLRVSDRVSAWSPGTVPYLDQTPNALRLVVFLKQRLPCLDGG